VILLPCPYCGARNASEFHYVGEVSTFLYTRLNPASWTTETWFHRAGCRQHFVVERHTVTNEVRASRLPDAQLRGRRDERATGGNIAADAGGATY
jgi:sarcosine oxidase delta subunit